MITLKYHLVDPNYRKQVDLRDYSKELARAVEPFPVMLDKVKRSFFQITITDTKKNRIVRKLGRQIAKTSLRNYARKKKGANTSYELFKEMKS